ncbi:MAG: M1 family metallopeptidase [Bacteroidota bacterium]|nr:M1 family metallopeptidase [Bacteroidota bacterium]
MKKYLLFLFLITNSVLIKAQTEEQPKDTSWKKMYRGSYPKINDLIHTKLDVKFDYDKSWMYGKAWITLHPHFYSTDSLSLDAKSMAIKEVAIVKGVNKIPLKYLYDGMMLKITLDKSYNSTENYTVYIDYTSKPNDVKAQGSAAITDAKGLYFINPKGEEKNKPTQIWTQGETEANSVWFPTIDKPNQKTTEEIYMTVPAKYVTLSNGLLISQKKNIDGTRTDYWKMDLPHAPYLFFMGVGEYSIIKDNYKGKEVSYYVEKEYAPVARKIFGETPAMIGFYEKITGVPYQWPKYAQITGRDYVSGAMENTSATLHTDALQQNARQLTDGNRFEEYVCHELFHQWFGDLVTTESWSNITLNESFANYSEVLWDTYRHGKDAGDEKNYEDMQAYIGSGSESKDLVRFYYADKEDMFDAVSYNKGGRILHMLRNYVGDDAFYKALNKYLTDNKFKSAEAQQLRLAFEDVTGQDLNWYWNQWYYGSGHPKLNINYNYANSNAQVIIEQTQKTGKIFRLPIAIDFYNGTNKKRYKVWLENKRDTFNFSYPTKPDLINVDADKILLVEKTDNKSAENFIHQWKYAPNYLDRRESLDYFSKKKMKELAEGLDDKYEGLREFTLNKLSENKTLLTADVLNKIEKIADTDPLRKIKALALEILVKQNDKKYLPLFTKYVSDSSYTISGVALEGLSTLDPANAYTLAKKYSNDAKGKLGSIISQALMSNGTEADFAFILNQYKIAPPNEDKLALSNSFGSYLIKIQNATNVRSGVDEMMKFRNLIPEQYRGFTDPVFKNAFTKLSKTKKDEGNKELADYISSLIK